MLQSITRQNAWLMWLFISFFYAYQYVLRVLPNIIMPEIMERFHIDAAIFGQFSGFYYIGYAGAHLPLGILLDRKGPRIVIPLCILLTVMGLLSLIFSDQWIYPSLGRILIGIGSSSAILGAFKIIRMGFAEQQFTRMLGICVTIGLIGAIYGGQPIYYALKILGWQEVLWMIALVGIALAALIFIFTPSLEKPVRDTSHSIMSDLKDVFTNYKVLSICLLAGFMVGPLEGFADVWGSSFLRIVYGFAETIAAALPSFIFLGMLFGAPVFTYLADKTQAYFTMIILSALWMGVGFVALLCRMGDTTFLSILLSMIGVTCAYQILAIYKASTFVSERLVGLTTAVANMIIMTFGYVFHSVIGFLMQSNWDGAMQGQTPIYSAYTFTLSLSVIPLALFIAAIGFVFVARSTGNMPKNKRIHSEDFA